jgi:hypothetical protein
MRSRDPLLAVSRHRNRESILLDLFDFDHLSTREAPDSGGCAKIFWACANSPHARDRSLPRTLNAKIFIFGFSRARIFPHAKNPYVIGVF